MVSDSSLPDSSVTRVCHTVVLRPLCSGVASARTVPLFPAAKKLVFDSMVAVASPSRRLRNAAVPPTVSASAIRAPPCRLPCRVRRCPRISISATTRSGPASTKRMPRCSARSPFQLSPTRAGSIAARPRSEEIAAVADPQQGAARVHLADADVVEARVELELPHLDADRVPAQETVVGADGEVIARIARGRGDSRTGVRAVPLAARRLGRGPPFRAVPADAEPDVGLQGPRLEMALDADVSPAGADGGVGSVLEGPRGRRRRGRRVQAAGREEEAAFDGQIGQQLPAGTRDQGAPPPLSGELVVLLGDEPRWAAEHVQPAVVRAERRGGLRERLRRAERNQRGKERRAEEFRGGDAHGLSPFAATV